MYKLDPVTLEIFKNLFLAIPEEMGGNIRRASFSPNIKERMDESCAVFDAQARLIAQAEHIPVHLGAMPAAVQAVIEEFPDLSPGNQVILNDPYRGGSHLPDITVVAPFFRQGRLKGFVVNRAHHADVGGKTPGSMPGFSSTLSDEGIVIPPTMFVFEKGMEETVLRRFREETRNPGERIGDLNAQVGANKLGVSRCVEFLRRYGEKAYDDFVESIIAYSRDRVASQLCLLPRGSGEAVDFLDGKDFPVPIAAKVQLNGATFHVDFSGTSAQSDGNSNAPLSVTRSAVYYVFRCLLPQDIPANHGCYEAVHISALAGTLLNPRPPAAVSSGNVETSQRIVDVLLLALKDLFPQKIPAQGQGTMNNLTLGWQGATYYETIAGGMGGTPQRKGADAVQVHMTNTANTPVEALESSYPLRVLRTALRDDSGGDGFHAGGMGVIRELLLLEKTEISIQSERRKLAPKGIAGGKDGKPGKNYVVSPDDTENVLPGRCTFMAEKGTKIVLQTPGGGGWGTPENHMATTK